MTKWQRRLRAAIAVFGLGFAVLVYFAIRGGKPPVQPEAQVARIDRTAAAEIAGGVLRQLKGTREDFRVEYDRNLSYPDGRQRLLGARVFVDERAGRNFVLRGTEAEVGASQDRVDFRGGVELTSADGLKATAPEASYAQSEGIVRATGDTTFSEGKLTGSSVGLTYDKGRDVLWLLDQAALQLADETPDRPPVEITARRAGLARRDHYARFEEGFSLVHGNQTLQSDLATAYLSDDQSKVQTLEMRGHASVSGLGDAAGSLRRMQATDINLEFAEDGRTLRGATLSADALIEVAGAEGASRRISGPWIDVRLGSDGATVTSLVVREGVRLDLPAEGTDPAKTIQAQAMSASGENGQGVSSATFSDEVEYREVPAGKPAPPRVARARTMTLAVAPGFGRVQDAKFDGAFRFEEDDVRAASARGTYGVATGVVTLEGNDEATGQAPRVTDGDTTIDGRTVTVTLEGRRILAMEDVRSVMAPRTDGDRSSGSTGTTRPSMLADDQPVYAAAKQLAYDGTSRLATYTGAARLWQGDTAIQGDEVVLDGGTGNLTARGTVRSALMLEERDDETGKVERVPTIATSGTLVYEEKTRKATYSQNAHVSGPQGDLRASRVELFLRESGKELDRAEAYTNVTLEDAGRTATGTRMTYFAAEGRYLMSGDPVRIVAECRDTTGKTLTFYKATDTIMVDGNDETRTLTKGGAKCEARRAP